MQFSTQVNGALWANEGSFCSLAETQARPHLYCWASVRQHGRKPVRSLQNCGACFRRKRQLQQTNSATYSKFHDSRRKTPSASRTSELHFCFPLTGSRKREATCLWVKVCYRWLSSVCILPLTRLNKSHCNHQSCVEKLTITTTKTRQDK